MNRAKLPPKVLILTGKAGQGHLSAACSFDYWLASWGYHTLILDVLPRSNDRIYSLLTKAPEGYQSFFKASNNLQMARLMVKGVGVEVERLTARFLPDRDRFDLVISTHPLIHPTFGRRRLLLLLDPVVHATYCAEPRPDYYFSFWPRATEEAIRWEVPESRIVTVGPLVRPAFYELARQLRKPTDKIGFKKKLGLDSNRRVVLAAAGGAWINRSEGYLEPLQNYFASSGLLLVFICGRNQAFYRKMSHRYRRSGLFRFLPWQEESQMAAWMAAADGVLAFTVAQTSIEAGLTRLPIFIAGYLKGQEEGYRQLLVDNGVGVELTGEPVEQIKQLKDYLANGWAGERLVSWQRLLLLVPAKAKREVDNIMAKPSTVSPAPKESRWRRIANNFISPLQTTYEELRKNTEAFSHRKLIDSGTFSC